MENTPKKVAKPKLQLVISILVATSLILAELYVIINQPANVVLLVGVAVLVLIAVYFVIDAVVDIEKEKEIAIKEQYDNIYRSEKASYMLMKKKMEEFAEIIQTINQNDQTENFEEIIHTQKTLAKLVVSKNREGVDMLAEKLVKLENELTSLKMSSTDEEKRDRLFIELNNLEASLNDRLQGLSDKLSGFQEEIERLADHIAKINSEAIQAALNTNTVVVQKTESVADADDSIHGNERFGMSAFAEEDLPEETASAEEEAFTEENASTEEDLAALLGEVLEEDISDMEIPDVADVEEESEEDILSQLLSAESADIDEEIDVLAELAKAVDIVEEPVPAPVEEKKPTPPAPADDGGKMNQDDIAALIASMTGGDAAPAPVEEKKPTPPPAPADNGGKMNQDDIAALIASMTGN